MTTLDLRTPLATGTAVELGNKLWRKQVLPLAKIMYEGRPINFDESYLHDVAAAFRSRSHDTVPFVLADKDNSHTMAAERGAFGEAMGFEVDLNAVDPDTGKPAPGLYSTLRLSDAAEEIVRANRRFGVSLRVKQDYTREPDGTSFARACQHVLGTWDPKIAGMSPWQQVELSNDPGTAVIDLSALTYTTKEAPMAEKTTMTPEELFAKFQQWLQSEQADADGAEPAAKKPADDKPAEKSTATADASDTEGDSESEGMSDDEFEALVAGSLFTDDDADTEGVEQQLVTASNSGGTDVELAQVARDERLQAVELSNRTLRAQLDAAQYERERAQLVRLSGLPPADIDKARKLLEGTGRVVELANGETTERVDAGEIVRDLLKTFGERVRLLDLSAEIGAGADTEDPATAEQERKAKASAFVAQLG